MCKASHDARSDEAFEYRRLYALPEWKALRIWRLRRDPLCAHCLVQGLVTQATIVDHKIQHRGDIALFLDPSNVQSLCKPHHDSAKQSHERTGNERGCDANGMPIDPSSHWNTRRGWG